MTERDGREALEDWLIDHRWPDGYELSHAILASDWLKAHDAEVAATVLRDAAEAWQHGQWADAPRRKDRIEERIANGQFVTDWLRARADESNPR